MSGGARLLATGGHLPGAPIDNTALARVVGPLPDEVLAGLQVETRHWIADSTSGEHIESNSEMAVKAAQRALEAAGVAASDVDLLALSTSSPEYHLPPMVTQVQDGLGLERCGLLEVRGGCAGFVQALEAARLMLERGDYRRAVVIGSEAVSPLLVPIFAGREPDSIRMRDRIPAYAFGDGAGAVVLERVEDEAGDFIGYASACVGGGKKPGMVVVGGATHAPVAAQLRAPRLVELKLDVVESARFTPHVLAAALADLLGRTGVAAADVDACVVPEGNAGYLVAEMEREGTLDAEFAALGPRIVENLARVGATGSAAVPLALDEAWRQGRLSVGSTVMLLALETSKWIYAGSLLRWSAAGPPH